jgi:uncharacterized membrane protein (DUF106 family)
MSQKLKVFMLSIILFLTLLFGVITASYLRNYYEAVNRAEEYIVEGEYEMAKDELEFAHRSIRGMFITFIIWAITIAPLAYEYYKTYVKKK